MRSTGQSQGPTTAGRAAGSRAAAPEVTRCPAGGAEVEMAELYVKPGESSARARLSGWGRAVCLPEPQYNLGRRSPGLALHFPSSLQATRRAAGTIRRSSLTGCRPRLADPSARRSLRGSPPPRMDPLEVRGVPVRGGPRRIRRFQGQLIPWAFYSSHGSIKRLGP